jgi:hypothetical protein
MNEKFMSAAAGGDLSLVQRMLASGDARLTDTDHIGVTALMVSARVGWLQNLIWMLKRDGARITDRDQRGYSILLFAALSGRIATMRWLLEHGGADIADATNEGLTVWKLLTQWFSKADPTPMAALLRIMVLRSAPPVELAADLSPHYARVCEEGARLRAALPAYLARRRALLNAHCPLIAPLLALVRGYDPEPTTTEELWATGLGAAP